MKLSATNICETFKEVFNIMKKRLLITSIVMMLVVAVALSTATYAWFTSNSQVTASTVTMTAAVNGEASIGISWESSNFSSSITAASPEGYFVPTAISSKTADAAFASMVWSSATVKLEDGDPTFNDQHQTGITNGDISGNVFSGTDLMTYTYTDGDDTTPSTTIYINNGSSTNDLSAIVAKVAITGQAREFMRVAIFRNDGTAGAFQLKGIMADRYTYTAASGTSTEGVKYYDATGVVIATGDGTAEIPEGAFTRSDATGNSSTAVGTVTTGAVVATAITAQNTGYSVDCGSLAHTGTMALKVVVWMDGTQLTDATAGTALARKSAIIAISFDASR